MAAFEFKTHPSYRPEEVHQFFEKRGWPVHLVTVDEIQLTQAAEGSAVECGDGRFDQCPGKELYGPRILGGINAVAAMVTGGTPEGYRLAAARLKDLGYTPGTHSAEEGGCGYFDLWVAGRLESARFPYANQTEGKNVGEFLRHYMKRLGGGKHFRLVGEHVEEATRLNPYIGLTEAADDCSRFRIDDWLLAQLGVAPERRYLKIAESIEQLRPRAKIMELIIRT